jgi:NADH-quinone oxidoreductase subunit G
VVGTDHVDAQLGDGLPAEAIVGLPQATIAEVVAADTIVLLAPDIKEELPVLYLRLRSAAVEAGRKIIEISSVATGLTPYAALHLSVLPGEVALVADALFADSAADAGGIEAATFAAAKALIGDSVAVVVGRGNLAENEHGVVDAARVIARHRSDAKFLPVVRRGNVRGAIDAGLAPGFLPGRRTLDVAGESFRKVGWKVPSAKGLDCAGILSAAAEGDIEVLVLVGSDPLSDFIDRAAALEALKAVPTVVFVGTHPNASCEFANVVLPAAAWGERSGTTTNIEGRVTRIGQKVVPPGVAWPDYMIALELASLLDATVPETSVEGLQRLMSSVASLYAPLADVDLGSRNDADGVVVSGGADAFSLGAAIAAPSAPPRDSYALRLVVSRKLYDDGTSVSNSAALVALGQRDDVLQVHPSALSGLNLEAGVVRVVGPAGSTEMSVVANDDVPRGVARAVFSQKSVIADVVRSGDTVCDIKLESVS